MIGPHKDLCPYHQGGGQAIYRLQNNGGNAMKITDLIIDPKSLGSKLWLVDVSPAYGYQNNITVRIRTVRPYPAVLRRPVPRS